MPRDRDQQPEKKPDREAPDAPRTDLPPEREPYYEGYFGTEEEEGVVREEESGDVDRSVAEDAAGGDRGVE